ncbi:MAG TPA: hypothetical protein VNK48_17900 [Xanthobacteraceae bacterium]|nr:hypothetical protein [Xanthobacteraceae bacterium]
MSAFRFFLALVAAAMLASAVHAQSAPSASADDTARLLAGLAVAPQSPLYELSQDPHIRQQAAQLEAAFERAENTQLVKIRAWSAANLSEPSLAMFYMFGGPDFLYADAFFPNAKTYVLSGLEPVGPLPDLTNLPRWAVAQALRSVQVSLRTVLRVSYFITAQMSQDLNAGPISGTLPILYVFLARTGKTIHSVNLVHLDDQGVLQPGDGLRARSPARGVEIVFSAKDGTQRKLYYFSTNLADQGNRPIALLQFAKSLGQGDSFVKSASYLMHNANFSQVRNFLLENSKVILQDDSGIPIRLFDPAKWEFRPYGRYVQPIPIFEGMYQERLAGLYQRSPPRPIDFGVGYRWYPNESNLLMAIRLPADVTASVTREPSAPTAPISRAPVQAPPRDDYRPSYEPEQRAYRPPLPPGALRDEYPAYYEPERRAARAPQPPPRPRYDYEPQGPYYEAYRGPPPPPPFPFFPFFLFLPPTPPGPP